MALVRLGFLLSGDAPHADTVTQDAFVRLLGLRRRPEDANEALDLLRAAVLARCRAVRGPVAAILDPGRAGHAATVQAVRALPQRERAVVVLVWWAGLGTRQVARTLGLRDGDVEDAGRVAAQGLRRPDEAPTQTEQRVADALQRASAAVHPAGLTSTFADRPGRIRPPRWARPPSPPATGPAARSHGRASVAVGRSLSPRLGRTPSRRRCSSSLRTAPATRSGRAPTGWSSRTSARTPAPHSSRSAPRPTSGTWPRGRPAASAPPTGGRRCATPGPGRRGTSCSGPTAAPRSGSSTGTSTDASAPSTRSRSRPSRAIPGPRRSSSPLTGATHTSGHREGGILVVDLTSDAVGHVPLPGAGCVPQSRGAADEVVVVCSGSVLTVAPDRPGGRPVDHVVPGAVAGAWQATQRLVLQLGSTCSSHVVTVDRAGRAQSLTGTAAISGLVPNGVVGDTLYLGGTRCADDGGRLVAYDLAGDVGTELVGEAAGGRTVRQAVLVQPLG